MVSKSTTLISVVSRLLRWAAMSFPERKTVLLEERAWTAKSEEDSAIEGSKTVTTFENVALSIARGDTEIKMLDIDFK